MKLFQRIKNLWELSNYEPKIADVGKSDVTLRRNIQYKKQLAKVVNIPKIDNFKEPIKENEPQTG